MQRSLPDRSDIDGLRGLAVLALLVADTSTRWLVGGFFAIDVLLVVSGYLITATILAGLDDGQAGRLGRGGFDLLSFYRRRLRRALPALLLVIAVVLVAGWFLLFAGEYRRLGEEAAAGATFTANFVTWTAYDGVDERLLHQLWLVATVGQFCLVWPVLLMLSRHRAAHAASLVGAILAVSFAANLFWSYRDPALAFYSPLSRAWELMVGSGLLLIQRTGWKWGNRSALNTAATMGCLLLAVSLVLVDNGRPTPGWRALLPVLGAGLLLSAGPQAGLNRRILGSWPLAGIGLVSYPLYLWHWTMLAFANILHSSFPSHDTRILVAGLSLVAAIATHLLVERPLRRSARPTVATLLGLAAATGAVGGLCFLMNGFPGTGFRDPARQAFVDYFKAQEVPAGCSENCLTRDPARPHAVLLWGDGHARQLYVGLQRNLPADWQVLEVSRPDCPPDALVTGPSTFDSCRQMNWAALQAIAAIRPDVVVMAQDRDQFISRFNAEGDKLKRLGVKRTLFMGPTPHWTTGLPTIVARQFWQDTPHRTTVGVDGQIMRRNALLLNNFSTTDGMAYVDVIGLFCNTEGCTTYLGDDVRNGLTSLDQAHLTPVASDYLAKNLLVRMILNGLDD